MAAIFGWFNAASSRASRSKRPNHSGSFANASGRNLMELGDRACCRSRDTRCPSLLHLTPLQFCSDRSSDLSWEDLPIGQDGSLLNAESQGAVFRFGPLPRGALFGRFGLSMARTAAVTHRSV